MFTAPDPSLGVFGWIALAGVYVGVVVFVWTLLTPPRLWVRRWLAGLRAEQAEVDRCGRVGRFAPRPERVADPSPRPKEWTR